MKQENLSDKAAEANDASGRRGSRPSSLSDSTQRRASRRPISFLSPSVPWAFASFCPLLHPILGHSGISVNMHEFEAKLVAAATGSMVTALTSKSAILLYSRT